MAPTLNPEELEKRIEELRTVQFWLEQNARMLAATIQALEVQRMTLSTLKSMNVPLGDLRDALKLQGASLGSGLAETPTWPGFAPELAAAAQAAASAAMPAGKAATKTAVKVAAKAAGGAARMAGSVADSVAKAAGKPENNSVIDPTQWWSALSQQFTQLATSAMKDTATDAAKGLAGSLVKHSFDAASETLRKAATVPGAVVESMAGTVAKGLAAGSKAAPSRSASRAASPAARPAAPSKPAARPAVKRRKV